jgi:hypothetical protein
MFSSSSMRVIFAISRQLVRRRSAREPLQHRALQANLSLNGHNARGEVRFLTHEPVHYEVFIRRNVQAGWTLEMATESRAQALETAEDALTSSRAIGVKVSKELRRENGEYNSLVIYSRGELEPRKKGRGFEDGPAPLCVTPSDLYSVHARARIARLFEGWLRRQSATAFELLHRPDLVEKLEATGLEVQHAIQKVAVPEAQATGVSTHEVIRRFQKLADGAIARLLGDARRGLLPDLDRDGLDGVLSRAGEGSDPAYLLGCAVAQALARAHGWTGKVECLLGLADAGADHPRRALLFRVLEQPLAEILGDRGALAQVLRSDADLGYDLALVTRLVLPEEAERISRRDAEVARALPGVDPGMEPLARWLRDPAFSGVSAVLVRWVLQEMQGPRRLHPGDPAAELLTLRALARLLVLTGELAPSEDVQAAFVARSNRLVAADFVEPYLERQGHSALGELQALIRLAENLVGPSSRRALGDWVRALVSSHRFERELRTSSEGPALRLQQLAEVQRALGRLGLDAACCAAVAARLGEIGAFVDADVHLVQTVARAGGPVVVRLSALLRLASGEAAPQGPVSRRARAEALKLARDPAVRAELARAAPAELDRLRKLLQGTPAGVEAAA